MKTTFSMNMIRLAALTAFSLMPGMACTYSVAANAPTLGPSGGYVYVSVSTQPGCRWSVTRPDAWVTPSQVNNSGSGTLYMYVSATRVARSGLVRVYPDWISAEYTLSDGQLGGRSSVTGAMLAGLYQFRITEN